MRNERKYKIISLMTTLLALLLLGNCAREMFRIEHATAEQHEQYVLKGAKVYAANCVQCHGPAGEGVIGMPLNREVFQVDYTSPGGAEHYNMIYNTLKFGRKGNDSHFQWVGVGNRWLSYSTMPAWHTDSGGPLDDDFIHALTLFIMNPDGEQWNLVGDPDVAPIPAATLDHAAKAKDGVFPIPNSPIDPARNAAARALLSDLGKSQCLTCHAIGSQGGFVGPDLSKVGSWGVSREFLIEWIKYANVPLPTDKDQTPAMPHERRMPVYWAANRATNTPELNLKTEVVSEGPYRMPRMSRFLTDDEIGLIVDYLMGLK